jgi:hypothetical protein
MSITMLITLIIAKVKAIIIRILILDLTAIII